LHSVEVSATDEAHYLALADTFLGGQRRDTTEECIRRSDGVLKAVHLGSVVRTPSEEF
jgi:hypothetical protein